MEPPPLPIDCTSMRGIENTYWLMMVSEVFSGWWSKMIPASKLVPWPMLRDRKLLPVTPAAGPEPMVYNGVCTTSRDGTTPPVTCSTRIGLL